MGFTSSEPVKMPINSITGVFQSYDLCDSELNSKVTITFQGFNDYELELEKDVSKCKKCGGIYIWSTTNNYPDSSRIELLNQDTNSFKERIPEIDINDCQIRMFNTKGRNFIHIDRTSLVRDTDTSSDKHPKLYSASSISQSGVTFDTSKMLVVETGFTSQDSIDPYLMARFHYEGNTNNMFRDLRNIEYAFINRLDNGNIGDDMFASCTNLKGVFINNVSNVGQQAFLGCANLQYLYFDYKINGSCFVNRTLISIQQSAFAYCTSLKKLWIPDTVKTIADHAFINCTNLSFLKLSKTTDYIGKRAFENHNIDELYIYLSSLSTFYVGDGAFRRKPRTTSGDSVLGAEPMVVHLDVRITKESIMDNAIRVFSYLEEKDNSEHIIDDNKTKLLKFYTTLSSDDNNELTSYFIGKGYNFYFYKEPTI